jgi:hypothetical protein
MAKKKPGDLNNLIGGQIEDSQNPSILSNRIHLWLPPHVPCAPNTLKTLHPLKPNNPQSGLRIALTRHHGKTASSYIDSLPVRDASIAGSRASRG